QAQRGQSRSNSHTLSLTSLRVFIDRRTDRVTLIIAKLCNNPITLLLMHNSAKVFLADKLGEVSGSTVVVHCLEQLVQVGLLIKRAVVLACILVDRDTIRNFLTVDFLRCVLRPAEFKHKLNLVGLLG